MTNPFVDTYKFTESEEKEFLEIIGNKGMALLQKFFLYKSSVLRDRAMSSESDEETMQYKWGAAAILSLAADFPSIARKHKAKAEEATEKLKAKRKPKTVFGSDAVIQ